jgi:hypothetical protein
MKHIHIAMNNVSDTHPSAPHNVHICCIFLNMTIKTKVKTKEEVLIMMWASEIAVQSVAMGTKNVMLSQCFTRTSH